MISEGCPIFFLPTTVIHSNTNWSSAFESITRIRDMGRSTIAGGIMSMKYLHAKFPPLNFNRNINFQPKGNIKNNLNFKIYVIDTFVFEFLAKCIY